MRILTDDGWIDGFLDQAKSPRMVRIQVIRWRNLERLQGLYFVRDRSPQLLWQYLKEIGFRQVVLKVVSRYRERLRNEKYVSCGYGIIIEPDIDNVCRVDQRVVFLAPCHPRCMERVTLPLELVCPISHIPKSLKHDGTLIYIPTGQHTDKIPWWNSIRGWSEHSGLDFSPDFPGQRFSQAEQALARSGTDTIYLDTYTPSVILERRGSFRSKSQSRLKTACLFGYGNYAKTSVRPNIEGFFDLAGIHEIDPTQIPIDIDEEGTEFDTSSLPREDRKYDVYFVAGYHHTHAPLAVHALKQGAYAVVEKPLVTSWEQLEELLGAMKQFPGKLFACFQKRFSEFNGLARRDLGVQSGDPISCHCIVYEVPLPDLHWYCWPNSRSRLVSNGCHWIDHFLFLNGFASVVWSDLHRSNDGMLNVSVELENGAFFSMVLTDTGSERVGMREYIELRAGSATVRIVDGARYISENSQRILRRKTINKVSTYTTMYRQIASRIINAQDGDSHESVKLSASLMLSLEDKLAKCVRVSGLP